MRIPQPRDELLQHLREQLRFLEASARSYDAGFEGESKRLAVVVRVLVHDTSKSKSLLGTLGIKDAIQFHDGVGAAPPGAIIFAGLRMGFTLQGFRYYPKLEAPIRSVSFAEWWEGPILVQKPAGISCSRRDAILALANTDGGAHVDSALDATYSALSRHNAFGWEVWRGGEKGIVENSPALPITHQVAHEIAGSLEEQLGTLLGTEWKSAPVLPAG